MLELEMHGYYNTKILYDVDGNPIQYIYDIGSIFPLMGYPRPIFKQEAFVVPEDWKQVEMIGVDDVRDICLVDNGRAIHLSMLVTLPAPRQFYGRFVMMYENIEDEMIWDKNKGYYYKWRPVAFDFTRKSVTLTNKVTTKSKVKSILQGLMFNHSRD